MTLGLDFLNIRKKRPSIPLPPQDLPTFPSPKEIDFEFQPSIEDLKQASGVEEVEETRPEPQMSSQPTSQEPIYLKIHAFREIMTHLQQLRSSLDESEQKVIALEETGKNQERAYRDWQDTIKNMHEKLMFVDQALFRR